LITTLQDQSVDSAARTDAHLLLLVPAWKIGLNLPFASLQAFRLKILFLPISKRTKSRSFKTGIFVNLRILRILTAVFQI